MYRERGVRRWTTAAVTGLCVAIVGAVIGAAPASAATHSGTRGCAGQFGYVTATTGGSTVITPPGSDYDYIYSSGGTRTRVAAYSNGTAKQGGGYWIVYGSSSAQGSPYCSSAGR